MEGFLKSGHIILFVTEQRRYKMITCLDKSHHFCPHILYIMNFNGDLRVIPRDPQAKMIRL